MDDERKLAMGSFGQRRFRAHLAWENSEKELVALYSRLLCAEKRVPAMVT
jgi:hypothetical protein